MMKISAFSVSPSVFPSCPSLKRRFFHYPRSQFNQRTNLYGNQTSIPSAKAQNQDSEKRQIFHYARSQFNQRTNLCGKQTSIPSAKAQNQDSEKVTLEKNGVEKISSLLFQSGVLLASIAEPAMAVTGNNNNFDDDLTSMLIQSAIIAFFYFLVVPPLLMNWMRLRWYDRKLFEMYVQFMLVFIFFPGLLLWAPFLNFRKFPRDPSMKYPWSTPSDLDISSQKLR